MRTKCRWGLGAAAAVALTLAPLGGQPVIEKEAVGTIAAAVGPLTIASCRGWGCTGLIAFGNTLYFTSFQYDANSADSASFYRTSKSGGGEVLLYQEVGDRPGVYYFGKPAYVSSGLRGSSYAYFAVNDYGVQTSLIKRVPLTGGTAVVLGYAPEYIGDADFVTDGTRLFWADRLGIRSMPITGGAIQTLASFPGMAASQYQIAVHASSVYYTFGNQIRRVPKAGGTSSTVFAAPGHITDLYVHAPTGVPPALYWGEAGGAVRSLNAWGFQYTHQWPTGRRPVSVGFDGTRGDKPVPCLVRMGVNTGSTEGGRQ